jgi:hypothetical protein
MVNSTDNIDDKSGPHNVATAGTLFERSAASV